MSGITHWKANYLKGDFADQEAIAKVTSHNGVAVERFAERMFYIADSPGKRRFPPQNMLDILYNADTYSYSVTFGEISESGTLAGIRRDDPDEDESEYLTDNELIFGRVRGGGAGTARRALIRAQFSEEDDDYPDPGTKSESATIGVLQSIDYEVYEDLGPVWEVTAVLQFQRDTIDAEGELTRVFYNTAMDSNVKASICGYDVGMDPDFDGSVTLAIDSLF